MDRPADFGAEHVVHEAVLGDAGQARELGCDDGRAEVVATARPVLHVGCRAGEGGFDALADLVG
jgi:hypothetical protein